VLRVAVPRQRVVEDKLDSTRWRTSTKYVGQDARPSAGGRAGVGYLGRSGRPGLAIFVCPEGPAASLYDLISAGGGRRGPWPGWLEGLNGLVLLDGWLAGRLRVLRRAGAEVRGWRAASAAGSGGAGSPVLCRAATEIGRSGVMALQLGNFSDGGNGGPCSRRGGRSGQERAGGGRGERRVAFLGIGSDSRS